MNKKLFIGLVSIMISTIMLYTFSEYADWYVKHTNMLTAGILVASSMILLELGIILSCDYLSHKKYKR